MSYVTILFFRSVLCYLYQTVETYSFPLLLYIYTYMYVFLCVSSIWSLTQTNGYFLLPLPNFPRLWRDSCWISTLKTWYKYKMYKFCYRIHPLFLGIYIMFVFVYLYWYIVNYRIGVSFFLVIRFTGNLCHEKYGSPYIGFLFFLTFL